MHVFLIAAVTIDGFIDRGQHEASTTWTSAADKQFFSDRTKRAQHLVMGSTTFATIGRPLPGRVIHVLSSRPKPAEFTHISDELVSFSALSPRELVTQLAAAGVEELAVCGGSRTYATFLREGLIETLYLTVEPVAFGTGIPLFGDAIPAEVKLSLQSAERLSEQTLLCTYTVLQSPE